MLRKIVIVQHQVGRQLTRDENLLIFKQRPDFVVLPEYYNVNPDHRDTARTAGETYRYLDYCRTLSDRFDTTLIAGSAITSESGRFYNTSIVYNRGREIGRYRKTNPTENERRHGIAPGNEIFIGKLGGVRFSIMICADVLYEDNFNRLQDKALDIVFVPVTSPLRVNETIREKYARDRALFVAGARTAGCYIAKCCAVGHLWGGQLQGRSLVAAPWDILTRIPPHEEDRPRILSFVLDITEIRDFRRKRVTARSRE